MIWSTVLGALGILGLWLSARGKAWGFLIGLASQPLWIAWSLLIGAYGFIPASFAYAYVYFQNYRRWRPARSPRDPLAWSIRCRLFGHVASDYTLSCSHCGATKVQLREWQR